MTISLIFVFLKERIRVLILFFQKNCLAIEKWKMTFYFFLKKKLFSEIILYLFLFIFKDYLKK